MIDRNHSPLFASVGYDKHIIYKLRNSDNVMSIEYGISCCIFSVILASFTLQSPSKFLLFSVPDSLIREAQYSLPVRHAWLDKNSRRMEQGAGCKFFSLFDVSWEISSTYWKLWRWVSKDYAEKYGKKRTKEDLGHFLYYHL